MNPIRYERDDWLDDTCFWAYLYQHWVKPRVGDGFCDGEQFFFGVREKVVNSFFRKHEGASTGAASYGEYSVLLTLRNRWRIGVVVSMYPEDCNIHDVVVPPTSDERIVIGVNDGNSKLPALRWEELLMLRDAVVPSKASVKAKAILLLFPSVSLLSGLDVSAIQQVLERAWAKSGIPVQHASQLVARPIDDFIECHRLYPKLKLNVWSKHGSHGWINDSPYSLRNPKVDGSKHVIPVMRELFSSLGAWA